MTIFIAPIADVTDHVKGWLKEEGREVHILWLIYSKTGQKDYKKIADKLARELKSVFPRLKIKLKSIDSGFDIDQTMDVIDEIIDKEMDDDETLTSKEFTINITGGTKIMAAAAMASATWRSTKAHYVLKPQNNDPVNKRYVVDLPIKSIGEAKLNATNITILKEIAKSDYQIENTPEGIEPNIIKGSITRVNLQEKITKLQNVKENRNQNEPRLPKKFRLEYPIRELIKKGYIEKFIGVEQYSYKDKKGVTHILGKNTIVQKSNKKESIQIKTQRGIEYIDWQNVGTTLNEVPIRYNITAAGVRMAKKKYMTS